MRPPATILITMAGNSDRFRQAGYSQPKFMLPVKGCTLFHWAISSLRNFWAEGGKVVFIARREHEPAGFIRAECAQLGISEHSLVLLDMPTDGQATTVMQSVAEVRRPQDPVLIYNIDTHVDPAALYPQDVRGDGWIPCFPGLGAAWSFAEADSDGRVSRVAEKVRISPHATIGLYWFRSFELFQDLYSRHYRGWEGPGEKYIAPLYNTLVAQGGSVYIHSVPAHSVCPLGTPDEVRAFAAGSYEMAEQA